MRELGVESIKSLLPGNLAWIRFTHAVGFDGEGEGGEGGEGEGGTGEGGEGEGEGEGGTGEGEGDDETAGLKKALAAERLKSKRLERDLAAAKKTPGKGQGSTGTEGEGQGSGAQADPAMTSKLERLTVGFRETALRSTIGELAKDFRDVSDVLANIDTSLINYEQDDDDPTIVVWDETELKTAIKDLAKRKPYLLKAAGEGEQGAGGRRTTRPTGGQFGRVGAGGQRTTAAQQQAELARRIPALRTAVRGGGTTNGT